MDNEEIREEQETWVCACCGEEIDEDIEGYMTADGDHICEDCYEENYFTCDDCGEILSTDLRYIDYDRNSVCEDCIDDHYFYCDECQEYYDTNYRDNYYVDGITLCERCYCDEAAECCVCGESHLTENMTWDDDAEGYVCGNCDRSKRKAIHNYGYKPLPKFKTSSHDVFETDDGIKDFVMGVELEVDNGENPEETAAQICDASEDVYCKHDGSLNDGIEIVTHPCTLNYHMNDLGWKKIVKIALENGFRSHDAKTCGLHVHVGRKGFGSNKEQQKEAIAKTMYLLDRFWPYVKKFSRRKDNFLDRWAARPNLPPDNLERKTKKNLIYAAMATERDGRYQAINLQNSTTIEFRLFNGTLKINSLFASLQFVYNICSYAKDKNFEDIFKAQWKDVMEYHKYPELDAYLVERELKDVADIPIIEWEGSARSSSCVKKPIGLGSFVVQKPNGNIDDGCYRPELDGYVGIVVQDDGMFTVDFGFELKSDRYREVLHDRHGLENRYSYRYYREENLMLATDAVAEGIQIRRRTDDLNMAIGDVVRMTSGILKGRLGRIANVGNKDGLYYIIIDGLREGSPIRNTLNSGFYEYNFNFEHVKEFKYGELVSIRTGNSDFEGSIGVIRADGLDRSGWDYGVNIISEMPISTHNLNGVLTTDTGLNVDTYQIKHEFRDEYEDLPKEENVSKVFNKGDYCVIKVGSMFITGVVVKNLTCRCYEINFGVNSKLVDTFYVRGINGTYNIYRSDMMTVPEAYEKVAIEHGKLLNFRPMTENAEEEPYIIGRTAPNMECGWVETSAYERNANAVFSRFSFEPDEADIATANPAHFGTIDNLV